MRLLAINGTVYLEKSTHSFGEIQKDSTKCFEYLKTGLRLG